MRNHSLAILKNPACLLNILLSFEVFALINYFLLQNLNTLPPRIPIWFSQFFLSERLDTPTNIFFFPALGAIFLLINFILVEKLLAQKESLLAFSLSCFSLLTQLFLALATLRIILVSTPLQ